MKSAVRGHLARLSEIQREICRLQAEEIRRTASYVHDQLKVEQMQHYPVGEPTFRAMIAEVAVARRTSTISASNWIDDAWDIDENLPYTLDALERGDISLWSARTIRNETSAIDDIALRRLADEAIAEEAPDLLPGQVKKLAQTRVMTIDPAAADARAEQARNDKSLTCRPHEPGTAFVEALLPAEQALACWNAVHDHAIAVYAGGDPEGRSVSHIMCDTFVERLTGTATAGVLKTHLKLVMTDRTLLGLDNAPAHIVGLGPVPRETARLIAATGDTWVKRVLTDPVDGSALLVDTKARRFTGKLRDSIVTRDQGCRGPRCATKAQDIDHIIPHCEGGPTKRSNGQGLSKGCHTMRDHPDVAATRSPDTNAVTWTLPSGATCTSLPPPALGPGSLTRDQL